MYHLDVCLATYPRELLALHKRLYRDPRNPVAKRRQPSVRMRMFSSPMGCPGKAGYVAD